MILTFSLKWYNTHKQCQRKPRESRAEKAKNKVRSAKEIMDVKFTLFGRQEEIKVKKLCKIKSLR